MMNRTVRKVISLVAALCLALTAGAGALAEGAQDMADFEALTPLMDLVCAASQYSPNAPESVPGADGVLTVSFTDAFFKVGQTYGAEVGVTAVVPLETEHSERRVFKPERAGKVITAAMKQSLKAYRPVLHPLTPFREAVLSAPEGRKFIAHCAPAQSPEGKAYLPATLRRGEAALILIGPEGDFSPEEIAFARANGFEEITLGAQRLRTETAAVAAVVMVSVANG